MTPPVLMQYQITGAGWWYRDDSGQLTVPVTHPEVVALLDIVHAQHEELSRLRRAALLPAPGVVS